METTILVSEVAKIILQGYFTMARQKGLTEEQTQELYDKTKKEFEENDPNQLESV